MMNITGLEMLSSESKKRAFAEITEDINAYLSFMSELGCNGTDCSKESLETIKTWGCLKQNGHEALTAVYKNFKHCRPCSLAENTKRTVCGCGHPSARLMIVGGVPEKEDAHTGKPFSGKEGELLDRIIAAMKLTREDIFITHAIKCCLPDSKQLNQSDSKVCRLYLSQELLAVKPIIICTFGEIAARSILETTISLSRLRGRFHDYKGLRVMPTYSLKYLLENPDAKRMAWEDIKQVMVAYEAI